MKQQMKIINYIFVFSLVLILILFSTCKRSTPDQRSPVINLATPFSPSGFATTLKLSANHNTINAGIAPYEITVTAILKKEGLPLGSQTIIFEVCDEFGNKMDLGSFQGGVSVISGTTNANGVVTVNYYTPLSSDLLRNVIVYIWATVDSSGDEYISGLTPIQIIGPPVEVILNVSADDFTLFAGIARQTSNITATLIRQGGAAIIDKSVLFEIRDADGNRAGIGYFEGNTTTQTRFTDVNGEAPISYFGPLSVELPDVSFGNTFTLYITATVIWLGEEFASEAVPLYITKI